MDRIFIENIRFLVNDGRVNVDEPMCSHTSFRAGGSAACFVEAASEADVCAVIDCVRKHGVPYFVMGNGSNLLVSDSGFDGVILALGEKMSEISVEGCEIHTQAGALLSVLAGRAREAGLSGLEFAAGIPGSVGGAIYMNAGAYGGEMKDVVTSVRVLDRAGVIRDIPAAQMDFSYRHSAVRTESHVVLSCVMRLERGSRDEIDGRMAEYREARRAKQPLEYPSAGSTFKRPEGYFAGRLIEEAGLKGYSVGGAQVSEKHCGFIINRDGATASDIYRLMTEVSEKVRTKSGVTLEPEVVLLGQF